MTKKRANGEGNIRKRKDGRWEGRYTAGYDETTGKRLIKNVLGKTQAEVKEKLARAITEAETLDTRRSDEYTLGTWLQTWYELYAKLTGRDLQWLYKDLQEHGRLREAQKGKQPGLSDSTIRGIHTMLHNALDRAVKERLIVRNPADDCVPPKIPKHEMKILPPEQIKSYLTAADQRGVLPMFYLELISGLRKGELVALQWSDLDIENKTISVSKQAGRNNAGEPDITRPKTENSIRKISIPQDAVDLLIAEHQKHPSSPWMFPSPKTGEMNHPDSVVNIHKKILKDAGLEYLRFHDLRHPYVKHTTKIFSLRLMDFQAQAYPDARRKTRGACQLLRVGQSRSPVRPLCNRKRFSCLPPQSKMSWILYAISMRLSGYTSTRSISISASSVVSASASKIALDASFRLSCRACSSCFCFACANTAA